MNSFVSWTIFWIFSICISLDNGGGIICLPSKVVKMRVRCKIFANRRPLWSLLVYCLTKTFTVPLLESSCIGMCSLFWGHSRKLRDLVSLTLRHHRSHWIFDPNKYWVIMTQSMVNTWYWASGALLATWGHFLHSLLEELCGLFPPYQLIACVIQRLPLHPRIIQSSRIKQGAWCIGPMVIPPLSINSQCLSNIIIVPSTHPI